MDSNADAIDRVADLVSGLGVGARPLREALAFLVAGPVALDDLVRRFAVPRRQVERLLDALDGDLATTGGRFTVRPGARTAYRERFALDRLDRPALPGPADALPAHDVARRIAAVVAGAPKAVQALDHVPATPVTALRRAWWLDGTFDLDGATLVCIGDHDLTSIAVCLVNPRARAVVADLDEDLLAYIDEQAAALDLPIRTVYADFRAGLPSGAREAGDLVFTDPPYTPEGVRLFLTRGLESLRDRANGRLVMAYGHGRHQPALGLKVQREIVGLSLATEAMLPHFNRYDGAQAIGSASDLYVCRPTAATWKALPRSAQEPVTIYTHGPQSLEGGRPDARDVMTALLDAATGPEAFDVGALVALQRPSGSGGPAGITLADVFAGRAAAAIPNARSAAVAAHLVGDPNTWLLRTLLALDVGRLALAVQNTHPALTSQAGQQELQRLVGAKWRLRFRRSTPDQRHAIVEAVAVPADDLPPVDVARRFLLDNAHRRLATAAREALVKASRRLDGAPLTKNDARRMVDESGLPPQVLESPLIELPAHRLAAVVDAIGALAAGGRRAN
ncbi:bis-aminopropyl spermidine synthase family protein [Jiangella rhizosphaerae]|uniref:Putative methyltransferase n=1 Tax=Jiangella rhizosphaerae TaxID=2293569 RepID=A0A418KQT0_9ACTN|nr:bis-aminopropyl spermidine synthase family protein [Jiangella rhizosphaerae]RIQ22543.1 putative methyltransferase [Jiangella rhizosphaerae]